MDIKDFFIVIQHEEDLSIEDKEMYSSTKLKLKTEKIFKKCSKTIKINFIRMCLFNDNTVKFYVTDENSKNIINEEMLHCDKAEPHSTYGEALSIICKYFK